jgi:carboxypeptidase Q
MLDHNGFARVRDTHGRGISEWSCKAVGAQRLGAGDEQTMRNQNRPAILLFTFFICIGLVFAPRLVEGLTHRPATRAATFARAALAQAEENSSRAEQYRHEMEQDDLKIQAEVKDHSELMKNLEYLTTEIGPRLTGSEQMQKASAWTLQRFKDYGVDAHLETMQVAHAFYRGQDTAVILSPIHRVIQIRSLGWSRATNGPVKTEVYEMPAEPPQDVSSLRDKVDGHIVLAGPPSKLPNPAEIPDNAYDAVIPPQRGIPKPGPGRRALFQLMRSSKPAVLLLDSGKYNALFNMGGGFGGYVPSPVPMAFLTHEDYSLISRLLEAGPVQMEVNLTGTFSPTPEPASITVAQIRGTEKPDEQVIIGGHLDSWDLGQGATDNGTGAMATLEAARTLAALHLHPRRTITFILFTGEEQGSYGARLFLKNHASEIPKMDGLLIDDTGTGKLFSIALENLYETAPLMQRVWQPIEEVWDLQPLSTRFFGASDHVPFLNAGVPAYFGVQLADDYRQAHHSQADTFDKVIPDQVNEQAGVLAAWAWNLAQLDESLPHHPSRMGGGE